MSDTIRKLEKAIEVLADSYRGHEPEEVVKRNFNRAVEAGRELYHDKECEIYIDTEKPWWQEEDRLYLAIFTSEKEIPKDVKHFTKGKPASRLFDLAARDSRFEGVVINPYSPNPFTFEEWSLVAAIVDSFEVWQGEE